MEANIPLGWKPLNLEQYDGTTDPNEHLDAFLTQANLHTKDDVILCRVFPTSLKGATLTWYNGLPPRSENNFDTLVERFSAHPDPKSQPRSSIAFHDPCTMPRQVRR
ncbi:hypothetical protein JHK87_022476 [Glycine soja]|nr:hypothetical protein JHK87_022476 [Glycine soja]